MFEGFWKDSLIANTFWGDLEVDHKFDRVHSGKTDSANKMTIKPFKTRSLRSFNTLAIKKLLLSIIQPVILIIVLKNSHITG